MPLSKKSKNKTTGKRPSQVKKRAVILGVPSCLGGNVAGCERGPQAIRRALVPLLKKARISFDDLEDIHAPLTCTSHDPHEKCAINIEELEKTTTQKIKDEKVFGDKKIFPILLGGDHSVNVAFIRAAAKSQKIGLLWFDAHGDYNTPKTTPSGNIHGMVISQLTGLWGMGGSKKSINPKNVCLLGTRSLDPKEKELLETTGVTVFPAKQIKRVGLDKMIQKAAKLAMNKTDAFHVSIDLDFFDPNIAPGVGTPVKGGFSQKHVMEMCKALAVLPVTSLDIVELNPSLDKKGKTAKLAAELIVTFLKNLR